MRKSVKDVLKVGDASLPITICLHLLHITCREINKKCSFKPPGRH